jgi:hypothetical protein
MKITPVLLVAVIEPVLPLWEALGFARTAEVPHGDALGFVALKNGDLEVMVQTVESARADEPLALEGRTPAGGTSLFIEVENLDETVARLPPGTDIFVPRRTTFYGATETFLRDSAGNVIILAQFA